MCCASAEYNARLNGAGGCPGEYRKFDAAFVHMLFGDVVVVGIVIVSVVCTIAAIQLLLAATLSVVLAINWCCCTSQSK